MRKPYGDGLDEDRKERARQLRERRQARNLRFSTAGRWARGGKVKA